MLGNFPQEFSHVGLVNTAFNLTPRQVAPAGYVIGMEGYRTLRATP